jgi:hypothetical protein
VTRDVRVSGLVGEEEAGMCGILSGVETDLIGIGVFVANRVVGAKGAVDAQYFPIMINEIVALDQTGHCASSGFEAWVRRRSRRISDSWSRKDRAEV